MRLSGLVELDMLIRQEDSDYFVKADTLKDPDPFLDTKMSFANPPFGQPWGGKDADDGVEEAVKADHKSFVTTEGRQGRFVKRPGNWRCSTSFPSSWFSWEPKKMDERLSFQTVPLSFWWYHLGKVKSVVTFLRMIY
ncbi:MAG: hypothetical protein ACLVJN_02910 [Streptococcus parasanguinis]